LDPIELFRREAVAWLDAHAERRSDETDASAWGTGSDSVALFQNLTHDDERAVIDAHRRWIRLKADAGYANLCWETEWGGRGLPRSYEEAFAEEEARFATPPGHEAIGITRELIAPTIRAVGTTEQKMRWLTRLLRADDLWCQLMSEPGAGSDVASMATRADREGDDWIVNGQKVWTSGAQYADWGYLLCRTDPAVPKHRGLTAFVLPMSARGVEVRPLRQLTGGSSFSEVFLTDVRIPDGNRLGRPGDGWRVALTTLGFERSSATGAGTVRHVRRLIALARHLGVASTSPVRQQLAKSYGDARLLELTGGRVKASTDHGATPGPEGSIGKLAWTQTLRTIDAAASTILGPRLIADSSEWGTYCWAEHLLGAVGYRIAGGSDEIQRSIIGERILGLPPEPRVDTPTGPLAH
jgi:alkylation response protein AidB-like acyl-CoA dehydrogenase